MIRARALAGLGLIALLTACAPMTPSPASDGSEARQCFRASQANGFHPIDRDTVHVTSGADEVFELELMGACPEIDWSLSIGIRPTRGSSFICRGLDAELIVPSRLGAGPQRCPVRAVRKLSPEEVAAARGG